MDSEAKDQEKSHFNTADWRFQNQRSIFCGLQPDQMINSYFSSSFLNNAAGIFLQNQSQISIDPSFAQWAPRSSSSNGINLNQEEIRKENLVSSPGKRKRGNQEDDKRSEEKKNSSGDQDKEDYVHIRARRGQATNSHSLAERVRREKISERMKFLQDLVPGCSRVTGKALMLDEIINYVQSLQRQVEFLSMKLATVSPSFDFSADGLFLNESTRWP